MLIKSKYIYRIEKNIDDYSVVINTNWGQIPIIERVSSGSDAELRKSRLKNNLENTGYFYAGLFYPKEGEFVREINGIPTRKKNIDNSEYF